MNVLVLAVLVLVLAFGLVVLFGAPYLPTLKPQTQAALDLIDLKPGQTLLELGSGDGRVVVAAAKRGLNVVGYELNPFLAAYSWLITRRYHQQVRIVCGNYWTKDWPPADGIFVFLLNRYMPRLDQKIVSEVNRPVKLVSFAFKIPGRTVDRQAKGVYLYRYK
jgi:16S rRNA A1518/A1519 N6-dimethyltransferase RsmA/KsgA/DIM1 with predicted DNA glycosylase/AP lyase activity